MSHSAKSDWIQATPLPVAADEARLLALLKAHHRGGLSIAELRDHGISAPAHAIYMLQLAGYAVGPAPVGLERGRPDSAFRLHAVPPRTPVAPRRDFASVDRAVIALLLVLTAVFVLGAVLL
jgi:hypothetical protein